MGSIYVSLPGIGGSFDEREMKGQHLRIVPTASSNEQETAGPHEKIRIFKGRVLNNAQLSLPLEDVFGAKRVILIPLDIVHGEQLIELLCEIRPKIVIDVRNLVRFNLPGMSRESIFKKLSKLSSIYIREPIRWSVTSRSDVMAGNYEIPVRIAYELIAMQFGCALVITEKPTESRILATALSRFLSEERDTDWVIERFEAS
jgi:hypothetical protein